MQTANRKVTYRLYPSKKQRHRMEEMLRLHQRLYNSALEERIDAYRKCGVSVGFVDQCRSLTQVRAEHPEYEQLNAQSSQVTLKRLDRAFSNFFRRLKQGEVKPGFPRFKSLDRFKGWGYKAHGDGWTFFSRQHFINGTLRLSGVGDLQARGRARCRDKERLSRNPGIPKTVEILKKGDLWFASVTFETPTPYRASGEEAVGIDWGTMQFLTIVNEKSEVKTVENPRHWNQSAEKLKTAQQDLSRKKKGSKNRQKSNRKVIRCHRRLAWKREDFLHQTSADVVKQAKLIGVETLNVKGMTSAGGSYKAGLNRSILDTAPGTFFRLLECKAAEAGIPYVEAPTRSLKPSQTCCSCGSREKKRLSERTHNCQKCGLVCDRDVNAALVILQYALAKHAGQELALGADGWRPRVVFPKHETPPIPEVASATAGVGWV